MTALTTTAKCKGRWRVLRRTCESDLSLYHRALVSEDQKEASAELAMDETLSCVQSDIMAVHRHQMAMPKDESTSERAARCVVDARQHKGSTRYNGQRERIYFCYAGSSISRQVYLCTSTMLERRWTPERTSRRVALVAALQTCIEDATKMYVETSGCLTAQGVRLPPAPSQQLESLLSARRGEVHVYLQRATGPGCPLLETFVWERNNQKKTIYILLFYY